MKFSNAYMRSVKADVVGGVITISFTVPLNVLETAEEVAELCEKDSGTVSIEITPQQLPMKFDKAPQD